MHKKKIRFRKLEARTIHQVHSHSSKFGLQCFYRLQLDRKKQKHNSVRFMRRTPDQDTTFY